MTDIPTAAAAPAAIPNLVLKRCPKGCGKCAKEYQSILIPGHKIICKCPCHNGDSDSRINSDSIDNANEIRNRIKALSQSERNSQKCLWDQYDLGIRGEQ